jgi:hypothetical protein
MRRTGQGDRRVKEPEWVMQRIGRGNRRVKEPEWEMRRTGRGKGRKVGKSKENLLLLPDTHTPVP